jgi:pimeloyl-ACP methyl ester carboxylesterase
MKKLGIAILLLVATASIAPSGNAQSRGAGITLNNIGGGKRVDEAKTKTIQGVVQDLRGRPIAGARVTIRNTKDNTARTALTDQTGNYQVPALAPDVTYEVRADYRGVVSEMKTLSVFLDREINQLSFQLDVAIVASAAAPNADPGPEFLTFDLVKLKASYEMPRAVPAPIPAVLLLHGYGEDRKVWESLKTQLLAQGFAVMSLDLRGHGDSKTMNQRPITASPDWRSSNRTFTQDLNPALDWLKKQPRLDAKKIVVIGYDIGANLALFASGNFTEVRTVVAIKPTLKEALEMAGSAQDFRPHSALVITADAAEGNAVKPYVKEPFRVLAQPLAGGTAQVIQSKAITDAILQWLKETY